MRRASRASIVAAVLLLGWAGSAAGDAARPRHPQFGYYELDKILDAFRSRGFVVSGEIRPKTATVSDSADRVVEQVRKLLDSGLPAGDVTVVGASMRAEIALLAPARLQNPEVRFAIPGACLSESVTGVVAEEGEGPSGRLLTVREASDEFTGTCPGWKQDPEGAPSLVVREIVIHTGLHHGFLYRPLPERLSPVVEWVDGASTNQAAEPPK